MSLNDIPLSRRSVLVQLATIEARLYDDQAAATAAAIALLGPGTVVTVDNFGSAGPVPPSLIATNGFVTVVVIAGTTNYQQGALQAMYSLVNPSSLSGWGTSPVWLAAAREVNARIADAGINPDSPILIVGHSYGGAAAANLAALYSRYNIARDVRLLTFGMPKPGDERLINILRGIQGMHIANEGDPVPSLTPDYSWTFPFLGTVATSILQAWNAYEYPPHRFLLGEEGVLTPSTAATFGITQLAAIVAAAVAGAPLPLFDAHKMDTYLAILSG